MWSYSAEAHHLQGSCVVRGDHLCTLAVTSGYQSNCCLPVFFCDLWSDICRPAHMTQQPCRVRSHLKPLFVICIISLNFSRLSEVSPMSRCVNAVSHCHVKWWMYRSKVLKQKCTITKYKLKSFEFCYFIFSLNNHQMRKITRTDV